MNFAEPIQPSLVLPVSRLRLNASRLIMSCLNKCHPICLATTHRLSRPLPSALRRWLAPVTLCSTMATMSCSHTSAQHYCWSNPSSCRTCHGCRSVYLTDWQKRRNRWSGLFQMCFSWFWTSSRLDITAKRRTPRTLVCSDRAGSTRSATSTTTPSTFD